MTPESASPAASEILSRREALRRAALALGVVLTPSLVAGALRAQTSANAGERPAPRYLSPAQAAAAAAIAERILPRTETPGALDVGVPAFIDLLYGEYLTDAERRTLGQGLDDVDRATVAEEGRPFAALAPALQDRRLQALAEGSQPEPRAFFALMRELTVLGYFTSETVGKTVLHYDPVPGRYDGCIPLAEVGNVNWTR